MSKGEETGGKADYRCVVSLQLAFKETTTFNLEKAVCSHGLFMMAPNRWDPVSKTLLRPLRLISSSLSLPVRISHPSPSDPLLISIFGTSSLSSQDQNGILAQVRRMLRISDENDRVIGEFHNLHEAAKESGFGRIFRSPTLFEDMVKCILLCNCQWSRSLSMARALCELQLDNHSTLSEDFQPKTPQSRERKREREIKHDVVMKLEAKYSEKKEKSSLDSSFIGETNSSSNSSKLPTGSRTDIAIAADHISGHLPCQSTQLGDFPSPEELAILDADCLAKRCKLGYRAQRIVSLAQNIVEHKVDLSMLEELCQEFTLLTYDKLNEELSGICGFGPFTRANVLMCMGFYHRIPADTETIRHLKQFHKRYSTTRFVQRDIDAIYGKYAPFQFLAYWFELWDCYEKRFGKAGDMSPLHYHLITASNMRKSV
ncbi:uncharacterized protein [Typha latifolia]|uniref:uncharacterized protein n=1 Tax=Typha latifolia TaxID=4733 RepID=UPI003C2C495D